MTPVTARLASCRRTVRERLAGERAAERGRRLPIGSHSVWSTA